MLQRILAAGLIVLGLVGIGTGVASATVWRESETVVASTPADGSSPLVVSEPGVLDMVAGDVTVTAKTSADKPVTLVIGREVDVEGWVGTDAHTVVTGLADWDTLSTRSVAAPPPAEETPAEGEVPAEGETATDEAAAATPVIGADPAGSDMWFAESAGAGEVSLRWSDRPGRWSLLAAGTGEDPAAPVVTLTWTREVSTPWQWPGIAGGTLLLLAGLAIGVISFLSGRKGGKPSGRTAKDENGKNGTRTDGRAAPAATPTSPAANDPAPGDGTSTARREPLAQTGATASLTRRELRERAERERLEAENAAQEEARTRPRNRWLTGQIPIVPGRQKNATAAQPVVPAPTTEPQAGADGGSAARADAWRQAWGFNQTKAAPPTSGEDDQTQTPDSTGGDR
ncbi:hypothetical protein [Oerskovia paurometabola]|uniref:hypothetical protein n=1 Tax=Oerskovia paurometabola TaxID=162170 RepID=UPI00381CB1D1